MEISSRSQAKQQGLSRYFTGKPCKYLHIDERLTSNGTCVTCIYARNLSWIELNKSKVAEYKSQYYQNNKDVYRQQRAEWRSANVERYGQFSRFYSANRRLAVRLATVGWSDLTAIKQFYYNCPKEYNVDHIIPLKGKLVCGLHTLDNLQYLPSRDNASKGNKFDVIYLTTPTTKVYN